MALQRLGILHISDLHFGRAKKDASQKKELIASKKLTREISSFDPKEIFLNKAHLLLRGQEIDVIAFTGDAGSAKDASSMEQGIGYLSKIRDRFNITSGNVIVAPGNHDLKRDAGSGEEFSLFIEKCKDEGFVVATRQEPASIEVKGIPIIALNTCLGGTEQAYYGLPDEFWQLIKNLIDKLAEENTKIESITDELKNQFELKDMDIPAIGESQFISVQTSWSTCQGNCAVVLGHHNPLPTQRTVIKPFADLIDSGRLIFNLISDGKKILFLHGHTHCDTTLMARSPEEDDEGFIVCLGANGLHTTHSGSLASATYIQLIIDDSCNFLCSVVTRIQQKGSDFFKTKTFPVWDDTIIAPETLLPIYKMEPQTIYTIAQLADIFKYQDKEELATQFLKYRSCHPVDINDVNKPIKDWTFIRKT